MPAHGLVIASRQPEYRRQLRPRPSSDRRVAFPPSHGRLHPCRLPSRALRHRPHPEPRRRSTARPTTRPHPPHGRTTRRLPPSWSATEPHDHGPSPPPAKWQRPTGPEKQINRAAEAALLVRIYLYRGWKTPVGSIRRLRYTRKQRFMGHAPVSVSSAEDLSPFQWFTRRGSTEEGKASSGPEQPYG